MAKKDANDVRRGERAISDLAEARLNQRRAGDKPVCGSPLAGSKQKGHANYGKGRTCQRPAGSGTDHPGYGTCSWHAGNMKAAKVAAARERATETVRKVREDLSFYGVRVEVGFEEALLEELQRSVGIVRWIEAKLATWGQTDDGDWKWDNSETQLPPLMEAHFGRMSVTIADTEYAAWLRMYQLERRHLHAVAADGIKAGIAKSMIVVYQQQADLMNAILRESLRRFGIEDGDDRIAVVLPAVIREITSARKTG